MTVMTRRGQRPRFQVVLYHDEPENAAADNIVLSSIYRSEDDATAGARARLSDHWQTASVHEGTWYPATVDSPGYFETDENKLPLRVGPDWTER